VPLCICLRKHMGSGGIAPRILNLGTTPRSSYYERRCKRSRVREVLFLLPNLIPHPVSLHITVIVFSKNEISIILFFASITIGSIILVSIYYINSVKCYSYRCCLTSFCTNDLGSMHIYCNNALASQFGKLTFVCRVTKVRDYLFVSVENNCLCIYKQADSISVIEKVLE
jgi:hypothetical protein